MICLVTLMELFVTCSLLRHIMLPGYFLTFYVTLSLATFYVTWSVLRLFMSPGQFYDSLSHLATSSTFYVTWSVRIFFMSPCQFDDMLSQLATFYLSDMQPVGLHAHLYIFNIVQ